MTQWATLGTFTPPDATVDVPRARQPRGRHRALALDRHLFSETTVQVHEYRTDVARRDRPPMALRPDTTLGNFFNRQHRATAMYQVIEAVSGSQNALGGLHLFKAGIDVLHSEYGGTSDSRPVLIERADGTLARRLDFALPSTAVDRQHGSGALRSGSLSAEHPLVRRSSAAVSIATAWWIASTSRRGSAPPSC